MDTFHSELDELKARLEQFTGRKTMSYGGTSERYAAPDERAACMHTIMSNEKDLALLRHIASEKDAVIERITRELKKMEDQLASVDALWKNKLELTTEERALAFKKLENEILVVRNENSLIKESCMRQVEDVKDMKRHGDLEWAGLRKEHEQLQKQQFDLKSELWRTQHERETIERDLDAQKMKLKEVLAEGVRLRRQNDELALHTPAPAEAAPPAPTAEVTPDMQKMMDLLKQRDEQHMMDTDDLARGIAHRVRNYLGIISGTAQVAMSASNLDKELEEQLQLIDQNVQSMLTVFEEYLGLARVPVMEHKSFNCDSLVDKALATAECIRNRKDITVTKHASQALPDIRVDEQLTVKAFQAILDNSVEAMSSGGSLIIETGYDTEKDCVYATLQDNGKAVSDNHIKKIFQPYFTTKKNHKGLGLPQARRIMDLHHGMLFLESIQGKGTKVTFVFPKAE